LTGPAAVGGRRRALLLACANYDDPTIPRLRSPERDAEELSAVLADPTRGRYEVRKEINPTVDEARVAIEEFLSAGRRDDLLLLYFSCHGILDARNELHLAFRNTRQNLLQSTGLSREWVHGRLNEARPQSSVVLVDCCFSGAFVHAGLRARAASRSVDVQGLVRDPPAGKARAVLTASTATQLSFEDEVGRAEAAARPSYFTEAVITAVRTGAADRDHDGRISVDDLYAYVYDRVTRAGHGQEPQRAIYGAGELVIAYAGSHAPEPPLPPEPPDSDSTLLVQPNITLAPWPPLPEHTAARHRLPPPGPFEAAFRWPAAAPPRPTASPPASPPRRQPAPTQDRIAASQPPPSQVHQHPPAPTRSSTRKQRKSRTGRTKGTMILALTAALIGCLMPIVAWLYSDRPIYATPQSLIAEFGPEFTPNGHEGTIIIGNLESFFGPNVGELRATLTRLGFQRGYARSLTAGKEILGVFVMEFGSTNGAEEAESHLHLCPNQGDRFEVRTPQGATGLRCNDASGIPTQEVSFVRSTHLYRLKLANPVDPNRTDRIVQLARHEAEIAR
jgi:hypothetical protein